MEPDEKTVHITVNDSESSESVSSNPVCSSSEILSGNSSVGKNESDISEETIRKLSSYYGSTLRSLSE